MSAALRTRPAVALAVAAAAVLSGVAALSAAGVVDAGHGADDADYTVEPIEPSDRQPGATGARYGQVVVAEAGVDLETLTRIRAVYEEGSFADCGPGDGETFGIDRGNTYDDYEIDETLEDNIKGLTTDEDVFEVRFNDDSDFGASTNLEDGDAVVSVAECYRNPEEPGWYQIRGSTTGVTADGEERTFESDSHYFYICDCEDEAEAREELGPPPSEPEPTATPTPTPEPTPDASGDAEDDGGDEPAAGAAEDADGGDESERAGDGADTGGADRTGTATPAPTPEPTRTPAADTGPTPTPEPTPATWEDEIIETPGPSAGDGPGFGALAAVVGLLGGAVLARRR